MPLDPRIGLAGQPVQIQPFDAGRTMLQAAQLQQMQQQRQMQELALQEALRQRQQDEALQAYIAAQMGQGQGTPLTGLLPEGQAGTPLSRLSPAPGEPPFIRGPQQAPWTGSETMSPAAIQRTQGALPGTTYRRMEETQRAPDMQQSRTVETGIPVPGGQAQRLTDKLDWREMYARSPQKGLQTFAALRQMEQGETDAQLARQVKSVEFLNKVRPVIIDQASLDKVRTVMQQHTPDLVGVLPETYTPEAMAQLDQQMTPVKERMQMMKDRLGMELDVQKHALDRDKYGLEREKYGLDRERSGLDREKFGLQEWQTTESAAAERQRIRLQQEKQALEARQQQGRAPDYGLGHELNAQVYADWGAELQGPEAQVTPEMVARSQQNLHRTKERQVALTGTAKPLDDIARRRLNGLFQAEEVAQALATEFTPQERAQFVGLGGLRMKGQEAKQFLDDLQQGKRQADPKFARFLALVNLQGREAFEVAGQALTGTEKGIVFGYIPTGREWSVQEFEQKLALANERIPDYIDRDVYLGSTPATDVAEARRTGSLNPSQRPSRLRESQVPHTTTYDQADVQRALPQMQQAIGPHITAAHIEKYWQSLGRTRRD